MTTLHGRYLRPWILGAVGYVVALALAVLFLSLVSAAMTSSAAAGLSWVLVVVPAALGAVLAVLSLPRDEPRARFAPLAATASVALLSALIGVAAFLAASGRAEGGGSIGTILVPVVTALSVGLASVFIPAASRPRPVANVESPLP